MKGAKRGLPVAAQTLSGIQLFQALSAEHRTAIAEHCAGSHHESGQEIVAYRDDSSDVYFIASGSVRATLFSYSGKRVSFREIGPGQIFGEWSAIDGEPRASNVVALADTFIVSMSATAFKAVVTEHPEIAWHLLEELTRLARGLTERVIEFSTMDVKNRLHAELLRMAQDDLCDDGSGVIAPFPTNEELASRISTRREAVNRELRHLEKTGLLQRSSDARIITNVALLANMVKEAGGD